MDFLGSLTVGQDATFDTGPAHDILFKGNLINDGTFQLGATEVDFAGGQDQLIGGTATDYTFGPFFVAKPGGVLTFGGGADHVTVNGPLGVFGGGLDTGSVTRINVGSLALGDDGTMSLGPSLTLNTTGNVTLGPGATLNPNTATVNFGGTNWTNNGVTITPGNWAANFFMPDNQTIYGSTPTLAFHNLGVFNDSMTGGTTLTVGGSTQALFLTGNVFIGDGAILDTSHVPTTYVGGDWGNNGDYLPGSGKVIFNGSTPPHALGHAAVQTIGGAQPTTFFNGLTVDNPAGVLLGVSQRVSGTLDLRMGDLTTAAYTLTLGSAATVTGTHEVVGAVQRTQTFTVGVPYQEAELNGIPEADLRLWPRSDGRWATQGPQNANPAENWIEQSGVTAFSAWAVAPANAGQGSRIHLPLTSNAEAVAMRRTTPTSSR